MKHTKNSLCIVDHKAAITLLSDLAINVQGKYQYTSARLKACFYKWKGEPVFFHHLDIDDYYQIRDFTQKNHKNAEWSSELPSWIVNYLPYENYQEFRENNYDTWEDERDLSKAFPEVDNKTFINILLLDICEDEEELFDTINEYTLCSNIYTNFYLMDGDNIPFVTDEWMEREKDSIIFVDSDSEE